MNKLELEFYLKTNMFSFAFGIFLIFLVPTYMITGNKVLYYVMAVLALLSLVLYTQIIRSYAIQEERQRLSEVE